jgi:hypothetical protein
VAVDRASSPGRTWMGIPAGSSEMNVSWGLPVELLGSPFCGAAAGADAGVVTTSKELTPIGLGEGNGRCHVTDSLLDLLKEI